MKKRLIISLLLFLAVVLFGCGSTYVMSMASVEENSSFNHYKFGAFKGTYHFSKKISEDTSVRFVVYLESEEDLSVIIKDDNGVVYENVFNKDNMGTYYIELKAGKYTFMYSSKNVSKGELLFEWKGE